MSDAGNSGPEAATDPAGLTAVEFAAVILERWIETGGGPLGVANQRVACRRIAEIIVAGVNQCQSRGSALAAERRMREGDAETVRLLWIAKRAAQKLRTMYQRSEVEPRSELDDLLNAREEIRTALARHRAATPPTEVK